MLLFIDTETTGLSSENDSLLEIAAIITDNEGNVIDKFHEYINPGRRIPAKIVKLTRITDDMVRHCRKEWEVLQSLADWIGGMQPTHFIAHNASFDHRFIVGRSRLRDVLTPVTSMAVIDTRVGARKGLKQGLFATERTPTGRFSEKQESIAAALNIPYPTGGAHSAINDVVVLKNMYFKLKDMGCF